MNDITREFAKQAGFYKYGDDFEDIIEKFAELIVAECLVTLGSIVCDTSGERDTLWVARKVVADHFGVES
jgi:hypothetical protein